MNKISKITEIDLEFVKNYLKIDYNDDDAFLETLIISAKSFIQSYLNKNFSDMILNNEEIPSEFTIACLALVSHWYEKREITNSSQTLDELPYIFSGILDMHRNWNAIGEENE